MSKLFSTSVGKKFIVSLSGLFLITFLATHLTINLFLLFGPEAYNKAAHFMATNPLIQIIRPLLAAGFIIHIVFATALTIANRRTRPVNYRTINQSGISTWYSRYMFVLGGLIFFFLLMHLSNFWFKLQFGEVDYIEYSGVQMKDVFSLVTSKFVIWWYALIYVAGAVFLGFHLLHGFQSAFQSIGLNNEVWRKRWKLIGAIYSVAIGTGFSIIPMYFLIKAFLS